MLESELHDRENNDSAGERGTGELTPPAPSVPAAVFQPPQVVFQPPAVQPEPSSARESASASPPSGSSRSASPPSGSSRSASPPSGSSRSAGTPGNGDAPGEIAADDDGTAAGRRRRRRPSRSRSRAGDQDVAAEAGDAPASPNADAGPSGSEADPGQDQPEAQRPRASRTRSRRASAAKDSGDAQATEAPAEPAGDSGPEDAADDADSADRRDGETGAGRRRRRKRRRGSADGASSELTADDPPDTVVHVRESNGPAGQGGPAGTAGQGGPAGQAGPDDVRSVRGSTRLEAKKQRRREGRETGRRRPPIITESEFLARRESVERTMVVRQRKDRTQIAVMEDGVLVEHYVNRSSQQSYVGNVYLGKVQNVLPSMEAAFVDVGKGRNAVLYAGEVNFDVSGLEGQPKRIESALKAGQSLIVQVTKDPVGHKGARLTSQLSLPGRYLVYVPGASMTGISRKLPDTERNRLKQILKKVMPEDGGVIVRTAAEGAAEEELARDVARLAAQWEAIEKKAKTANAPALLYSEPDLTIRVIRDVFNEDFSNLIVSGDEGWDTVDEYVRYVAPHLADRLTRWTDDRDVFAAYRIDEQLAKALERKVWLPSGGSLVIDKTEAMTVIDVNTGKFTGQGGNLEETVTRNNLEAAEEIVRQLRLRDVGGIVVIDFIDMVLESNRELVLRRLLECLARDRTKHQVAEVTSLGLVQMTRKRVGAGLLEAFSAPCECCNGRGVIITFDPEADAQAAHHVHPRGGAGNGSRGSGGGTPASPATVAARARPDGQVPEASPADASPADVSSADGPSADGSQAGDQRDEAAPVAAEAPDGPAGPPRTGRRRRRRPAASPAATTAAADVTAAGTAAAGTAAAGTAAADATPAAATAVADATPAAATAVAGVTAAPVAVPVSAATEAPAAPEAPTAPEAPAAPLAAMPEPSQAPDGAIRPPDGPGSDRPDGPLGRL
jgi:ribonuclease E